MLVRRSLLSALAVIVLAPPVLADVIPVPDYNFSDPTAPTVSPYAIGGTTAGVGSWQTSPPTAGFLYYEETTGSLSAADATTDWYNQAGTFYNVPFAPVDNLPGSQGGFMFDTSGLSLSQTLSSTYQAGLGYQLTVGIGGGSEGMPLGDSMQIGLFYMSGGSQTMIGTATVVNDDSAVSPFGFVDHLPDYTFTMPTVNAGDPWAGQNIGVALIQPDSAGNTGTYWDVDNVRVVSVPEPGSMALVAAGLILFVIRLRWLSANKTAAASG